MGKLYDALSERHKKWIAKQKMFFVATAPVGAEGHVNLSPKGLNTFKVLDDHTVAYLDLSGSGLETIAHIKQNQRITIMMTAFEGPPLTLRLFGKGEVMRYGTPEYEALQSHFIQHTGARSIIKVNVTRIQDSCGYSIPLYEYKGDRKVYDNYCEQKGREAIEASFKERTESIDGIKAN